MKTKTITLKPGSAKPLWAGNPFVYPKSADHWPSTLQLGEWVCVCDASGQLIGHGVFNPNSLYRIRMLSFGKEKNLTLKEALSLRLKQAIELRRILNLPSAQTNAYRLINSEGDGLSGLTIDVFNTHAVVAITGAWALVHRALLKDLLEQALPQLTFIWRPVEKSLKQEGWEEPLEEIESDQTPIQILENGLIYEINPYQGQKTGFYCDQRETRELVQSLSLNRKVLDVCCFAGGFSLHAALGGAAFVKGLDSSAQAIACATHNAQLNQLSRVKFEEADALEALQGAQDFDFIILDPPKLAPSQKHLDKALRHYQQLNEAALRALPENGLLLTCSCSQAVTLEALQLAIRDAALAAGKQAQVLKTGGAGPDHPVHLAFPEGLYLKWVLLRV